MKGGTHLVGALAAAATYDMLAPETLPSIEGGWDAAIFFSASLLGGLLPDICHPQSKAGRRASVFSWLIRRIFGHRTFTHSLIFLVLIAVLTGMIPGTIGVMIQSGVFIGMASHYILDMLTSQGIKLFYPIDTTIRFPFHTRTGSWIGEGSVNVLCIAWVTYYGMSIIGV
ncbi:metal-dependent hydrolase [Salicibibacter halophilus]|uniref:Metal-dependent hydrolase n=1 Tax=Salicibibacter halophilus TaxID=2502791 RepID=A0A514LER2_9BACI|nr:metal-dependent hydrolase [Salicibibacter halophilus]QDI90055.1 metal-dependent hydrolase [Salicibibacter halophilus]